jgi:hypothetical protein
VICAEDSATRAAAHFDAGLKLYQQGRMRDAAVDFLRAYALAPHADALFNAGLALEGSGDSAAAATAYAWALAGELRAEVRPDAEARFARISPGLGRVRVEAPNGATAEYSVMRTKELPAVFHVLPGEALVTVTFADGRLLSRRARVDASNEVELRFGLPAQKEVESLDARDPTQERPTAANTATEQFPWRTAGYVGIGTGVVLGVGAFVLRQATLGARDDFVDSGNTDADARERAVSLNTWTNVALVSSIVVGAAGAGLLVFAPSPAADVGISLGPGSAQVVGRF